MLEVPFVLILLNTLTVMFYSGAAVMQYSALRRPQRHSKFLIFFAGVCAVLLHAVMLYHWIDVGHGQNLNALNMFSLVAWLVALLLIIMSLAKPVENLSLFFFPLAALSILMALAVPGNHVIDTAKDPQQLFHILLSVASFGVFILATVQSIILAIQERRLRDKQATGVWLKLPALDVMEAILFQLIILGFILLTVLLVTSFYFYHQILWHRFLQKSILACLAWVVFAALLVAHKFLGWHGKKAVYCTLLGICLLLLTYFSTTIWVGYLL